MGDYGDDRRWSDKRLADVKRLLADRAIMVTSEKVDTQHASDMYTESRHIAVRLRRAEYASQYPWDFTIRSVRDSGANTELAKIVSGHADWMFYGHVRDDGEIRLWWLFDLDVFRAELTESHGARRSNQDGTHFRAFDVREFSHKLVIGSGDPDRLLRRWHSIVRAWGGDRNGLIYRTAHSFEAAEEVAREYQGIGLATQVWAHRRAPLVDRLPDDPVNSPSKRVL